MTPAQLLLAWVLSRGAAVIPKASSAARLAENLAAAQVKLDAECIAALDEIAVDGERHFCWDPSRIR